MEFESHSTTLNKNTLCLGPKHPAAGTIFPRTAPPVDRALFTVCRVVYMECMALFVTCTRRVDNGEDIQMAVSCHNRI